MALWHWSLMKCSLLVVSLGKEPPCSRLVVCVEYPFESFVFTQLVMYTSVCECRFVFGLRLGTVCPVRESPRSYPPHSTHLSASAGDVRLVHAAGDRLYGGPHRHICSSPPGGRNGGPHAAGPSLPKLEGHPTHHHLHRYQGRPDEISYMCPCRYLIHLDTHCQSCAGKRHSRVHC